MSERVLVVAAHPDDEILGCGATMARHSQEGDSVFIAILGEGITSRDDCREHGLDPRALRELKEDARQAGEIVGAQQVFTFDLPDNRFDSLDLLDVVKIIERLKMMTQPTVVYTHHAGDLNIDHTITQRAVLTAFRPLDSHQPRAIYAFEVPSATGWNAPTPENGFWPTHYVQVEETLPTKIAAMEAYRSERRRWPHPRSPRALEVWAQRRGLEVGLEAAEAFVPLRTLCR
ncbi:MAG TPA: PIG-L family deacetylase [Chthonomonadaceae bacterium]|nr:PIG-L family deacetylase [Chthonomonadaceae bacterium]